MTTRSMSIGTTAFSIGVVPMAVSAAPAAEPFILTGTPVPMEISGPTATIRREPFGPMAVSAAPAAEPFLVLGVPAVAVAAAPVASRPDPFLPSGSPTVAMLRLSGKEVPNTERFRPIDFTCCGSLQFVPKRLCLGLPIRVVCKPHPTRPKEKQYHWMTWPGGFSTLSVMKAWALRHAGIDLQQVLANIELMKRLAYGCAGDVPPGRPWWDLPCFLTDLTDDEKKWTWQQELAQQDVPLRAPDPDLHIFEDLPSVLTVDASESDIESVLKWYRDFEIAFPGFVTTNDYSFVSGHARDTGPTHVPSASLASASNAQSAAAVSIESATIPVVSDAKLLLPQKVESLRGRGRPKKGSIPIRAPFEVATEQRKVAISLAAANAITDTPSTSLNTPASGPHPSSSSFGGSRQLVPIRTLDDDE